MIESMFIDMASKRLRQKMTPIFVPRIEKLEEGEPTNLDIRYVDDIFDNAKSLELCFPQYSQHNGECTITETQYTDTIRNAEKRPENQGESPIRVERYPMLSATLITQSKLNVENPTNLQLPSNPGTSTNSKKKRRKSPEPIYTQVIEKRWKEGNTNESRPAHSNQFESDWSKNFEAKRNSSTHIAPQQPIYQPRGRGHVRVEQQNATRNSSKFSYAALVSQHLSGHQQNPGVSNASSPGVNAMQRMTLPQLGGGTSVAATKVALSVTMAPPRIVNVRPETTMTLPDTVMSSPSPRAAPSLSHRETLAAQLLHTLQREQRQIAGASTQSSLNETATSSVGYNNNSKQFDVVAAHMPPPARRRQIHDLIREHSNSNHFRSLATISPMSGINPPMLPGHHPMASMAQFSNAVSPGIRIPPPGNNCRLSWQMNGPRPTLTVDIPMYIIQAPVFVPMHPGGQRYQYPRFLPPPNFIQQRFHSPSLPRIP